MASLKLDLNLGRREDDTMPDDDDTLPDAGDFSRDAVQLRVDDWLKRLYDLFKLNEKWALQHGWQVETGGIRMNEELMQRFGVPPAEQPTQRLDSSAGSYALFKPKGLWVIGANGRIDLYTPKGAFIIVDRAEAGEPSHWTLFRADGRREGVSYEPTLLNELA